MSVLIKGMKMPKRPSLCRFYSYDPLGVRKPYCDIKSVCNGFDACPLVPVPTHGRLIDADDLKKQYPHDGDWDYPVSTNSYVVETIDKSPTIIEAEESE